LLVVSVLSSGNTWAGNALAAMQMQVLNASSQCWNLTAPKRLFLTAGSGRRLVCYSPSIAWAADIENMTASDNSLKGLTAPVRALKC
jgi:hypothetical protein